MTEPLTGVEAEFTLLKHHFTGIRRRTAKRYRCALATLGKITFPGENASLEAWAHNLSESGIGLNLDRSLPEGVVVNIRLKGPQSDGALTVAAKVAHSTQQLDGTWRVGCAFEQELTPEQLELLL